MLPEHGLSWRLYLRGKDPDIYARLRHENARHGLQQQTQEKSEAGVTAEVTQESGNGTIKFMITLETHSVALDTYKFDEIVVLRAGEKEFKGRIVSQEGSGHHRSAVVEFDNPKTKEVLIVIKGVAGVKERMFIF